MSGIYQDRTKMRRKHIDKINENKIIKKVC